MSQLSPPKPNLAERVADQLTKAIEGQGWEAGRRLPPARDLARQFNVSPNTAYSAIRLLAQRGVVGLKSRGSFIQRESPTVTRKQIGIIINGGYTPQLPPPPPAFSRDWGWTILAGAQEDMLRAGKLMTIIPSQLFDQDPLAALFERVDGIRETLAGIICFPLNRPVGLLRTLLKGLDERQIPYVTINRFSDLSHNNFVSADFLGGTRLLGRCLARMGIHRVLLLETQVANSHSEVDRVGGLFQGYVMESAPTREVTTLHCAGHHVEDGYEQIRRYLDEHPAPQAVVAIGDFLAQGAINALTQRGLRIPEDVGVIGGTGLPQAHDMKPALTTLAQPVAELGRQAMQMLLEMERADITRMTGRTIRGELIIRQSLLIPESIQRELADESETWTFKTEK